MHIDSLATLEAGSLQPGSYCLQRFHGWIHSMLLPASGGCWLPWFVATPELSASTFIQACSHYVCPLYFSCRTRGSGFRVHSDNPRYCPHLNILNYIYKDSLSKYGKIHRFWGIGHAYLFWGGGGGVPFSPLWEAKEKDCYFFLGAELFIQRLAALLMEWIKDLNHQW